VITRGCKQCGIATPQPVLRRTGGYCEAHAFMTIKEVRTALRASYPGYYRLRDAGKITPRQVGPARNGRVLVPRWEVDKLLGI
jgi:hypothetical protein